jgi:nucleotide-binding universal stress UspA family protein
MKILIATDGSEYSVAASESFCQLVSTNKETQLRVLSVVEPIAPTAPFGVSDEYYVQARNAMKEAAVSAVDESAGLISKCLEGLDIEVEKRTVTGRPKEAIVKEAEKWNADMIVLGSHGRGFWGRMLLGSVSAAVVKHAHCSVLVVRKNNGG